MLICVRMHKQSIDHVFRALDPSPSPQGLSLTVEDGFYCLDVWLMFTGYVCKPTDNCLGMPLYLTSFKEPFVLWNYEQRSWDERLDMRLNFLVHMPVMSSWSTL